MHTHTRIYIYAYVCLYKYSHIHMVLYKSFIVEDRSYFYKNGCSGLFFAFSFATLA